MRSRGSQTLSRRHGAHELHALGQLSGEPDRVDTVFRRADATIEAELLEEVLGRGVLAARPSRVCPATTALRRATAAFFKVMLGLVPQSKEVSLPSSTRTRSPATTSK